MHNSLIKGKWWHCLPFLFTPVFLASAQQDVDLGNVGVGPVTGTIVFSVNPNMQQVNLWVAATDLYRRKADGSLDLLNPKICLLTATPAQVVSGGADNMLAWTTATTPPVEGLPATRTESSSFEFPQEVVVTVQWDQSDPELPVGEYSGFVKLVAEVDGAHGEAMSRVHVNVVPSIVVSALPSVVNLGSFPPGRIPGHMLFRIDSNRRMVGMQVVCTDLYKGEAPPSVFSIPFAGAGAEITCEQGGSDLLAWLLGPPPGMLPDPWTGAVSDVGTFKSAHKGAFSQYVTVGVEWKTFDQELLYGEYSGYIKLLGMIDGVVSEASVQVHAEILPSAVKNVSANPSVLWPPNHKMVEVTVAVEAQDELACRIVNVTCNEPITGPDDGDANPDWQRTGDPSSVLLRAERAGAKEGRIYTIHVECTDASGTATATVDVTVPHDQGKGK
jgi:hypothetical protein